MVKGLNLCDATPASSDAYDTSDPVVHVMNVRSKRNNNKIIPRVSIEYANEYR